MRRVFVLQYFVFAFISVLAYAKSPAINFKYEIAPHVGTVTNFVNEYVFDYGRTLSRLDWKSYVLPEIALDAKINFSNIFVDAFFGAAIPLKNGIMEDFDFETYTSNPTRYSKHEIAANMIFDLRLKSGYDFKINFFTISPNLSFDFKIKKWTARNGFYQYYDGWETNPAKELLWNEKKIYFSSDKKIVSYDMKVFLCKLGVDTKFVFRQFWQIAFGASFVPFVFAEALDTHFIKNVKYLDTMVGGLGCDVWLSFSYKRFCIFFECEYFSAKNGKTKYSDMTSGLWQDDLQGGAGVTNLSFSVLFGYKFKFPLKK